MSEYIQPMTRVIVRGGRVVHAVIRDENGIARTACGSRRLRAVDRAQHDDEAITCPACLKETR
ncbi:hypothetical protein [Streptomyces phytophilus]|uniref:hypothetical protein n=1 Tax=Streptomyces phytophilus TaxID=722715 RepID=UPI0015F00A4B|nr:hypothetical protein [Streptomyces phytophilus]